MIDFIARPEIKSALVMFGFTVAFTSAFYWPAIKFTQKNRLVNFYWVGLWVFLSLITAIAGARVTLSMVGYDAANFSSAVLFGLTISFVVFVAFAWGRLALMAAAQVKARIT